MNKKVVAKKGVMEVPIKIYHWWPGREYAGPSPIPSYKVKEAFKKGSKYLTMACCGDIVEFAECCPRDFPSRKMGTEIALGRLIKHLEVVGWTVTS